MTQTDLDSPESSSEALQTLADQIVNRQSNIQNYILNVAIDFWLVRRIGLEPLSVPGRLIAAAFHFLTVLVPHWSSRPSPGMGLARHWYSGSSLPHSRVAS